MADFDLSVTICSWNTQADLRACLASLREARDEGSFEVIVVDNASVDGSAEMVRAEFPEFTLLAQATNLGFTGGHNLAIQARRGRNVALLNSDTIVHPGAIRTLIGYMAAHPEAGIVGPKLLNPDGSLQYSCRRFPNPVAALFRNTFVGRLFPKNRYTREYLMQDWPHDQIREVDWISGAAMFIRQEVIDTVGMLDPAYFMYCEDVDLCRRAWDRGFQVMYVPTAVITHAIGRSTDKAADRMIVRFHRSMLRFYVKHQVKHVFWPLRPLAVAGAALALGTRASLFLAKNRVDALRRRFLHR